MKAPRRLTDRGDITVEMRPPGGDPQTFECRVVKVYKSDGQIIIRAGGPHGYDFEISLPDAPVAP